MEYRRDGVLDYWKKEYRIQETEFSRIGARSRNPIFGTYFVCHLSSDLWSFQYSITPILQYSNLS
jgi:hypothetical protein